jgi:hypothetical protein
VARLSIVGSMQCNGSSSLSPQAAADLVWQWV